MDKVFPQELKRFATQPNVKKVFISDVPASINPLDCVNCGGVEAFAVFCAIRGPFQSPSITGAMEGDNYITSHFDDTIGNHGGWWAGITYTFPCPVCLGEHKQKPLQSYPVNDKIGKLVHPATQETLEW